MPLLNLPTNLQKKRAVPENASEKKEVARESPAAPKQRKSKKETISDEALSLHIFELFSSYEHYLITTEEQLLSFIGEEKDFGLDTETSGLSFYKDTIAGFSIGTKDKSAYIPLRHEVGINYQGSIDSLYNILSELNLYGFNWKFDKHFLIQIDPRFENINAKGDGYLVARLYNNNMDAGLKPLYKRFIDPQVEDYSFSSLFSRSFTSYDPALVYPYAAVDAQKHIILTKHLEELLKETPARYRLYEKLELPLTEVIGRMERHGVQLDKDSILALNKQLSQEADDSLYEIQIVAQDPNFNPGSSKQVGELLCRLGLLAPDTNGKIRTGEEVLISICDEHPLPKMILDFREANKLKSTYTVGLLDYADENSVAHPIFNQLGTDTGRFSSTRFNAQNIPKDNRFRNLFIPKEGNKLISVDYSQQEVRILAALAQDEVMIQAFQSGKDFYAVMASIAFNLPYDSCTKKGSHAELRGHMKSIVLGLNYDMSMQSLAKNLNKTLDEATEIYATFQKTCPSIDAFKKECKRFAYSHGYAETILKRRRYFDGVGYKVLGLPRFESSDPAVLETLNSIKDNRWSIRRLLQDAKKEGIYAKDREVVALSEERQCTNSVIQGSAADMTKLAMLEFDRDPIARRLDARIVLQIHDEVIIECPAQNAQAAGDRLAFIMNGVGSELMNGLPAGGVPDIMDRWTKE